MKTDLASAALAWYRRHRRELPWRKTHDPYAIWVSEIMLQQTQVATVVPYYQRFLARFPTPEALASASLDEVLVHWAGLGYYRRARQMHAAANVIMTQFGGQFPTDLEAVRSLPGIGRYTACAVLSFALDQRLGIVEANTQRLYARLTYLQEPTQSSRGQSQLWEFANAILPARRCGEFNQAMMEIGSQICTPREPNCDACPLRKLCPTFERGHTDRIPLPTKPKTYTELREAAILVRNATQKWLVRHCRDGERWAGLWDFPRFDITRHGSEAEISIALAEEFQQRFQKRIRIGKTVYALRHAVTRYRISLECVEGKLLRETRTEVDETGFRWCDLDELESLALNASCKRIVHWLKQRSNQAE